MYCVVNSILAFTKSFNFMHVYLSKKMMLESYSNFYCSAIDNCQNKLNYMSLKGIILNKI